MFEKLVQRTFQPFMMAVLLFGVLTTSAVAESPTPIANESASSSVRHHALSLMGKPQYEAGFKHFDWVNPNAPKGGKVRLFAMGSFDSLDGFSIKGSPASGLGLLFDSLMIDSLDEPTTEYGLIAEWVSYPKDYSSVTFGLRPEARFNDGKPIRPQDVVFSLNRLKEVNPRYAYYYKNVVKAEKTGEREVTFYFDTKGNRELPQIVGQLQILPEHFWFKTNADGSKEAIERRPLSVPIGSGPYRIKSLEAGRDITYERVKDWWAKDLPSTQGFWNFDEVSFRYYRDRTPAFEDFKKGEIHFWRENSAKGWATAYGFKAVKDGRVKKEDLKHGRVSGMQAFVFNTRKKIFKDRRVRQAFNLIYNFEEANKSLFYEQYIRQHSFFDNSELAATGKPTGQELEILESLKDKLPNEVFGEAWIPPKYEAPRAHRANMRKAMQLLKEAGWTRQSGVLQNKDGDTLKLEILLVQPTFERVVQPFIQDLEKVGIVATMRVVDSAQYKRRTDRFEYDMIIDSFGQSHSPGNEQRYFWGSSSASREGSPNTAGITDPGIDNLIERIVFAKGREELVAATRALDRALRANFYVIPQWNYPYDRVAYWQNLRHPEKLPQLSPTALLQVWWMDPNTSQDEQTAQNN